jgi:hypothetical protein
MRKRLVGINQENMGGDLILESLFCFTATAVRYRVVMQEEPASAFLKLKSYSTISLDQTGQYFLIHRLTWWNKVFVNDSLTVEECDQHHFVFLLPK